MKVVDSQTIRALDRRAMDEGHIPGSVLMENAGRAVFAFLQSRFAPIARYSFLVACGPGNNGGDGFVIARYLRLAGATVSVLLTGSADRLRGDALTHHRILRGVPLLDQPIVADVLVDALLGTGITGPPTSAIAETIRWMNAAERPIISVDVPSGVNADTGAVDDEAIRAAATVTFAFPKLGLLLHPGREYAGEIVVDAIGYPWEDLEPETPYRWIRRPDVAPLLPPRPADANKGMFGHVLVVGGSRTMSGAPTMTALAAMRTGAGLVNAALPASAQAIAAGKANEMMTLALPEEEGWLCEAAFEAIREAAQRATVICLGPGMGRQPGSTQLAARILREIDLPTVLDADGFTAVVENPACVQQRRAELIMTPHPGECGRLLGMTTQAVQDDRLSAVREGARRFRAVFLLKGSSTLIADGRNHTAPLAINTTGGPGLAKGGSGDTLTGIIGALWAQGLSAPDAAAAGAYLHGLAGQRAAAEQGERAMLAGDVVEALREVMRETFPDPVRPAAADG